tara:strand:+ start:33856 stop:34899 length:1044 start_codon:yes stop_codon:yes gene_type:complete
MKKDMYPILITGAAGFIGAALAKKLLSKGKNVVGIDNLNNYYDTSLKDSRLRDIESFSIKCRGEWKFIKMGLEDQQGLSKLFLNYQPKIVINLAAQAGVRYSLENPNSYIQSNLLGFANILENCRNYDVENFIFASSSSVYGGNTNLPFSESQSVDHPISLYAATKKSNELMAHSYSHLYDIPCTGLRFFTVYGPWGRPDMAPMIFVKSILDKKPINVFNYGNMQRDFTYIDDIVEGIARCCEKPAIKNKNFNTFEPDKSTSFAPFRIFNIGNNNPLNLLKFIEVIEENLGIKAIKNFKPIQPGDVEATAASTELLEEWVGFKPFTSIEIGVKNFIKWYLNYYSHNI